MTDHKETKRVFLLGAGFSHLAGFPVMSEFKKFIFNYLKKDRKYGNCHLYDNEELLERLLKIENQFPQIADNLEFFLSYIDLILLNNSFNPFQNVIDDLEKFRLDLLRVINGAFLDASLHFFKDAKEQERKTQVHEVYEIYQKFFNQLKENDNIVTFNYDLLIENGLWVQNKWTFLDGYGFLKNKENFEDEIENEKYSANKESRRNNYYNLDLKCCILEVWILQLRQSEKDIKYCNRI